jgi:class 3 adenylate cyclase
MHCSSCGFDNPEGMKFCGECGVALNNRCPQCGFENPPRFKFCGDCGTALTGQMPAPSSTLPKTQSVQPDTQPVQIERPPPEPPTPDAERRQLTVMFSDLVDSTKLSGQLDPEEYREVLRAYQQTCAEVIHRFGGYIAQHLGDALLVYFGYPQAHEDDAQRAIHTGLGMLEAMKMLHTRLEQDKGIRLAIRVGIHTGLTVVGDIGEGSKRELLALGEAPNVDGAGCCLSRG